MSTLFLALDVLDVENVGNVVLVPQSEKANYSVTKGTSGASIWGMSTASYYPQSFGTAAPDQPRVRPGGTAILVAGVAMVSAMSVFFALCERDSSWLHVASGRQVSQVTAVHAPIVSTDAQPARDSVTRVTVPTAESAIPAASEAVPARTSRHHVEFTLAHSKRFQQVGSIWVGIWKIDAKRKLYDVSVVSNGRRTDRKHVSLNSPVSIASGELGRPLQLVVNAISRSSVSGFVSETQAGR